MEQSWCVETTTGEVQDICPRCYVTGGNGAAGSRFAGAEYQEQGEPAVEPAGGGTGGVAEPAEKPAEVSLPAFPTVHNHPSLYDTHGIHAACLTGRACLHRHPSL